MECFFTGSESNRAGQDDSWSRLSSHRPMQLFLCNALKICFQLGSRAGAKDKFAYFLSEYEDHSKQITKSAERQTPLLPPR